MIDDRFDLRHLCDEDAEDMLTWRNSDSVRNCMFNSELITPKEHRSWFASARQSSNAQHLIFEFDGIPSGVVSFLGLEKGSRVSKWGFYLSPGVPAKQGLGSIMCFLGLHYGFESLRLHKIVGEVLSSNRSSIAIHRKLGFVSEGTLRSQHERAHLYCDVLLFGMLEEEWAQTSEKIRSSILPSWI
jgi:UDP-4-amino-4,6-dideoxy-N-acetyl-beta-L-altrosamine N-acetyltransferase